MKFLHLVWAGVWRRPGRATLTLLSIVNAFLLYGLLQHLNREQGKTVIMVTHDPKAASFAKRIVYLDKGALVDEAAGAAA